MPSPSQGYFPRDWGLQAWDGWVRMASGRGRAGAWFGFLFKAPRPPLCEGQFQCGVTWGGGVCRQGFSVPLSDGRVRVFAPPKAGFAPAAFALLLLPPPFPGLGGSGVQRPRGKAPPPRVGQRPLGPGGGAGSPGGLSRRVQVPSLSLARSRSLSFSFE